MKRIFIWRNSLLFYLIVISLFNLLLLYFPLTNVFGYEFSAFNALLISFLSGIYTLSYFKSIKIPQPHSTLTELMKSLGLMLMIPFVISVVNSIIYGFCSFWDGILFYLILTSPSVLVGSSLGIIVFRYVKKLRVLLFIIIYLFIFVTALYEIYFYPQVYLFNPLFGFFPGTIYDEGLSINLKILSYRFINTIFFWIIFVFFGRAARSVIYLIIMLIVASGFYYLSPYFGYSTTFNKLTRELTAKIETDHVIMYADKRIPVDKLKYIALNQEYYYLQLSEYLEVSSTEKIVSFLFKNQYQKKLLFGSGSADVAKPWLNQIYISEGSWEHTLKHEMAHCLSADFGIGLLSLAGDLNPALIEGVAEASDSFYDENDVHYMAALAFQNGYEADIAGLFSRFNFFTRTSSISYVYAGSFIKFLIDQYGIKKFKLFYASNHFTDTYGVSLNEVINNFESFLSSYKEARLKHSADYYFGRKPIFKKICPRHIAEEINDGWEQIRIEDYEGAQSVFSGVLEKDNNYSALIGLSTALENLGSLELSLKKLVDNLNYFKGESNYFNIIFLEADLNAKLGNYFVADTLYSFLLKMEPNRKLKYLSKTRIELLNDEKLMSLYLNGSDYDKYHVLRNLNRSKYKYFTFPVIFNLSEQLNEDYQLLLDQFDKNISVNDYFSSYGILKLSQNMMSNFDFSNARKMAGLALRYKEDKNLLKLLNENYNKAEWMLGNSDKILKNMQLSQ